MKLIGEFGVFLALPPACMARLVVNSNSHAMHFNHSKVYNLSAVGATALCLVPDIPSPQKDTVPTSSPSPPRPPRIHFLCLGRPASGLSCTWNHTARQHFHPKSDNWREAGRGW